MPTDWLNQTLNRIYVVYKAVKDLQYDAEGKNTNLTLNSEKDLVRAVMEHLLISAQALDMAATLIEHSKSGYMIGGPRRSG